jgi:hypothetical protein
MEDRYNISVDVGEGKDKGVKCWIRIGDDGKYIPATVIDTTTTLSFADSVQRSGYVGVEAGELTFSAEIVDVDDYALRGLFCLDFVRDMANALLSYRVDTCSRRRKTTYKTIRRDCAKRNRHK